MESMSDSTEDDTLCECCSLLSFDDLAIGGQEIVYEDGVARLHFPCARIEFRPKYWTQDWGMPDYRLVRLDWKVEDFLPDMPRLFRSCQLGCVFCQTLLRSLKDALEGRGTPDFKWSGRLELVAYLSLSLVDEGVDGLLVEATQITLDQDWFDVRQELFQTLFPIEADSNCEKWLGAQPARQNSYLDSTNIGTIHGFLNQCTSICHPEISSPFMPTRLIDVGHDESVPSRLVFSSKVRQSEQTKYAALSYCWGDKKDAESQFKTEKASLEDRCTSLPNELMTPTTKDAIAITRAIGLRYVWIDALCIIQDDEDDWLHESSRMNLVYRHAFVTLCTLNSDSCHEGFLNRAPTVKVPFQSTLNEATKGSYLIRLHPRTGNYSRTDYEWDYLTSEWSNRCWTYQEEEMSTRLLLFGSSKVYFSCDKYLWTEGDEAPDDISTRGILSQVTRFKGSHITTRELYQCWNVLTIYYGDRSVTFDEDRLPAIAGLARIVGDALQDQYLAGLWKGDLLEGLVWASTGAMLSPCGLEIHLRNIRQRNYVAPSWSWAACPAIQAPRVGNQHLRRITKEATIVDVGVDIDSGDPYGRVSGGFLRIRGKLVAMPTWLPRNRDSRCPNYWSHDIGSESRDILWIYTDWRPKDETGLELLVVMLLFRIEPDDESTAKYARALLLHPADGLKQYYRVGVIYHEGPNAYKVIVNWFKDSQEDTICII
ncbi:hypothetical protein IG631_16987 [Alternaria alternata]|nr:hypothetical protein IG631_16987 [Alternaria alternata]